MEKKKIYIIVGVVAVIGVGYYLWNKSKKPTEEKEATDNTKREEATSLTASENKTTPAPEPEPVPASAPAPSPKKLTAQELELKLQSECGKKPLLKKNKTLWNNCRNDMKDKLKSQGFISFVGNYEGVVSEEFYNQFDNSWDINL